MDKEKFNTAANEAASKAGAYFSSEVSSEKAQLVIDQIDRLYKDLRNDKGIYKNGNQINYKSASIAGGDAAEYFFKDTFNADAAYKGKLKIQRNVFGKALKGSNGNFKTRGVYAESPRVNTLGSADIVITDSKGSKVAFQSKYLKNGSKSEKALGQTFLTRWKKLKSPKPPFEDWLEEQKKTFPWATRDASIYAPDMIPLVPADQLDAAKKAAQGRLNEQIRLGNAEGINREKQILKGLNDRLRSSDGKVYSGSLTKDEATRLVKDAREGKLNLEEYGLSLKEIYKQQPGILAKETLKAGLSSAALSLIFMALPQIIGGLNSLMNDQQFDWNSLSTSMGVIAQNEADSFLQGSLSSLVVSLGEAKIIPGGLDAIGLSTVTLAMYSSIKIGIKLSQGKISQQEANRQLISELITSGFTYAFSAVAMPLGPLGVAIGSVVGSAIGGLVVKGANHIAVSFALKNNSTFFGLVDQDYIMDDEMAKKMGLNIASLDNMELDAIELDDVSLDDVYLDELDFNSVEVGFLRRGVIGISKIGYEM